MEPLISKIISKSSSNLYSIFSKDYNIYLLSKLTISPLKFGFSPFLELIKRSNGFNNAILLLIASSNLILIKLITSGSLSS